MRGRGIRIKGIISVSLKTVMLIRPLFCIILSGSNQNSPNNGGCMAVDFDDIKISNTGYIGQLNESTGILNEK